VSSSSGVKDDAWSFNASACCFHSSIEHDDGNVVRILVRMRAFTWAREGYVDMQSAQ
jgi:hypothetical protein